MFDRDNFYINGSWTAPVTPVFREVVNPATSKALGRIPMGSEADLEKAVKAARAAFAPWAATPLSERSALLAALASAMKARADQFAEAISSEMGAPRRLAAMVQVGMPISVLESYVEIAKTCASERKVGNSLLIYEAVGVCGMITPWNYPLHQIIGKVAPALAAGCTMILKPSELAPYSAFLLAEAIHEVGFPAGVFNLVSGDGPVVGEAIARHPGIDMVSFTGSTRAGTRVAELAAASVKRVTQELGGKSANLILEDADLNKAVVAGARDVFFNSGQTCSALTRMLVPRARQDEAAAIAAEVAAKTVVGDPTLATTHMGPLVSADQKERVLGYMRKGIAEGATLVCGGLDAPDGLNTGCYVRPTVFKDVDSSMSIAREEIFGPVLCILPYTSEAEAIAIANDSDYGLSGAVWSSDQEHALRVARQLRTGQVSINNGRWNILAPFGGYKRSGNGRELGEHGLLEYQEVKSLQL